MTTRAPRHQHNIEAKADRALIAIDSLIETRLTTDPDFPEIVDLDTGRRWLLHVLGNEHPSNLTAYAAMWVAVGIEHDRLAGVIAYRYGDKPTNFHSSRPSILAKLDALIWIAEHPAPADPFAGLNGGPVAEAF